MIRQNFNQVLTYWGSPSRDGFGGSSYASPILLECRWEEKMTQFTTPVGVMKTSKAEIFVNQPLDIGGFIILGDHTDQTLPGDVNAFQIEQSMEIPNLRTIQSEIKVYV